MPPEALAAEAAAIHARAIVIDAHADIPWPPGGGGPGTSIDTDSKISVRRLRQGGVDALVAAVYVPQLTRDAAAIVAARSLADAKLEAILAIATLHSAVVIARTADDIERAAVSGRTAILISLFNASPLGGDVTQLDSFHARGISVLGLVHRGNNDFADSSRPLARDMPDEHGGLSDLGRQAVARANALGMLLDVSQLSAAASREVLAVSRAPVIASHSAARALLDTGRNLADDEIRAIAAHGGVIGVVAFNSYLRAPTSDEQAALAEVLGRYGGLVNGHEDLDQEQEAALARDLADVIPRASLDQYLDHVDHVVRVAGIDHVALSSDFENGDPNGIVGWADESEAPNVTQGLVARGYDEAGIRKIWGGNLLRVLRAAQAVADIADVRHD